MARLSTIRRIERARARATPVSVQRPAGEDEAVMMLAAIMSLPDGYVIRKDDRGIHANVSLNIFSGEFSGDDEIVVVQAIGDWLCKLPKGVWDGR